MVRLRIPLLKRLSRGRALTVEQKRRVKELKVLIATAKKNYKFDKKHEDGYGAGTQLKIIRETQAELDKLTGAKQ